MTVHRASDLTPGKFLLAMIMAMSSLYPLTQGTYLDRKITFDFSPYPPPMCNPIHPFHLPATSSQYPLAQGTYLVSYPYRYQCFDVCPPPYYKSIVGDFCMFPFYSLFLPCFVSSNSLAVLINAKPAPQASPNNPCPSTPFPHTYGLQDKPCRGRVLLCMVHSTRVAETLIPTHSFLPMHPCFTTCGLFSNYLTPTHPAHNSPNHTHSPAYWVRYWSCKICAHPPKPASQGSFNTRQLGNKPRPNHLPLILGMGPFVCWPAQWSPEFLCDWHHGPQHPCQ